MRTGRSAPRSAASQKPGEVPMIGRRSKIFVAVGFMVALFASSCGDDGGSAATTTTAPTGTAATATSVATTAPRPVRDVTIMLPGLPGAAAGGYFAASTP